MRILAIGDIFGEPGRKALHALLPGLVQRHRVDFVVVNVDNAAGGKGITDKIADEMFVLPIQVMTAGNHVWEQSSIFGHLESHPILRPYNVVGTHPGKGYCIASGKNGVPVAVIHLQGKVFMENKGVQVTSPFRPADALLKELEGQVQVVLVDLHAEVTAEKRAVGWYLDGRVSAVLGTHTHVQTSDEEIMPGGTAYITDMGMTGPHQSVIGLEPAVAIERFLSEGQVKKFKVASLGARLEGVLLDIDENSGKARKIERVREIFKQ